MYVNTAFPKLSSWEKGKKMIGLGVNFSSATRNIEDWVAEELG